MHTIIQLSKEHGTAGWRTCFTHLLHSLASLTCFTHSKTPSSAYSSVQSSLVIKKTQVSTIGKFVNLSPRDMLLVVMELMSGGELFDRISKKKRFTEREACRVTKQVCISVSLSVCLSVCLSVYLSVCLPGGGGLMTTFGDLGNYVNGFTCSPKKFSPH